MTSPFLMFDFYDPEYVLEFSKDTLKYELVESGKYNINVFVFNVYELPIKYFHSAMLYMDRKEVECTLVTFADDSQIYCTLDIHNFIKEVGIDYIIKTNESDTNI